jgi:phage pi2 protein 07
VVHQRLRGRLALARDDEQVNGARSFNAVLTIPRVGARLIVDKKGIVYSPDERKGGGA